MQFLKNFFKHDAVIGLTGLKRKTQYVFIDVPKEFKKTRIQNIENNYFLI